MFLEHPDKSVFLIFWPVFTCASLQYFFYVWDWMVIVCLDLILQVRCMNVNLLVCQCREVFQYFLVIFSVPLQCFTEYFVLPLCPFMTANQIYVLKDLHMMFCILVLRIWFYVPEHLIHFLSDLSHAPRLQIFWDLLVVLPVLLDSFDEQICFITCPLVVNNSLFYKCTENVTIGKVFVFSHLLQEVI